MSKRRSKSRRRTSRRNPPGCSCSDKCCGARDSRCRCRKCHRRNHAKWAARGTLFENPPRKPKRKPKARRSSSSGGGIKVTPIGLVKSIEYVRGGKRWRHTVEGRAQLLAPVKSADYVVINGVRASRFLEG